MSYHSLRVYFQYISIYYFYSAFFWFISVQCYPITIHHSISFKDFLWNFSWINNNFIDYSFLNVFIYSFYMIWNCISLCFSCIALHMYILFPLHFFRLSFIPSKRRLGIMLVYKLPIPNITRSASSKALRFSSGASTDSL